jgi:hypothetical protein
MHLTPSQSLPSKALKDQQTRGNLNRLKPPPHKSHTMAFYRFPASSRGNSRRKNRLPHFLPRGIAIKEQSTL